MKASNSGKTQVLVPKTSWFFKQKLPDAAMVAKRPDDDKIGQQGCQRPVVTKFPGQLQVRLGPNVHPVTLTNYESIYD
jgi:hypothetical protein